MNEKAKVGRDVKQREAAKRLAKLEVKEEAIQNFLEHDLIPDRKSVV